MLYANITYIRLYNKIQPNIKTQNSFFKNLIIFH